MPAGRGGLIQRHSYQCRKALEKAHVLLPFPLDIIISACILRQNVTSVIGTAVIPDHQVHMNPVLPQDAVQLLPQVNLPVIRRHQHHYVRLLLQLGDAEVPEFLILVPEPGDDAFQDAPCLTVPLFLVHEHQHDCLQPVVEEIVTQIVYLRILPDQYDVVPVDIMQPLRAVVPQHERMSEHRHLPWCSEPLQQRGIFHLILPDAPQMRLQVELVIH